MLTDYLQAAMGRAKYEILEGDEGFYGEIPGFHGVYSKAQTLEECRNLLEEVLEDWVFLNIADRTPLPKIGRVKLNMKRLPEVAVS